MCQEDSIRKLKGVTSKWIRYHISMLTTLQPEDNCSVANTRASRGCQGTRCCCWKENVLSSASGSCKCNPERMRASRALQRGTQFHYLNAVQITKHVFVTIFFIDKHKTRLDLVLNIPPCQSSLAFTHWRSCNGTYYICVSGGKWALYMTCVWYKLLWMKRYGETSALCMPVFVERCKKGFGILVFASNVNSLHWEETLIHCKASNKSEIKWKRQELILIPGRIMCFYISNDLIIFIFLEVYLCLDKDKVNIRRYKYFKTYPCRLDN